MMKMTGVGVPEADAACVRPTAASSKKPSTGVLFEAVV